MRLLVIRTSAMGDVALTTPVLRAIRTQFPETEIILLTRSYFKPFFLSINGVLLFTPDFNGRHKGLAGLIRLFRDLISQGKIDHVIDIHDVLRTKILRFLFRFKGVPVSVIDKGRNEKRALNNGKRKIQLKHTVERYCDVFARAGFQIEPVKGQSIFVSAIAEKKAGELLGQYTGLNIGVAPYAKHQLKMWPEENMISLLNHISEKNRVRFWLFGGKQEKEKLESFEGKVSGSTNLSGKLSLDDELAVMSRLDIMIAMDSSNMHMAALAGTKVISIWGGTDPLNGFGAWMQPENYSIKIPVTELTCRPCTTYGKGTCKRGDLACMNWLTPEIVFNKIEQMNFL
jgi:ADP-heptose:LPS heptosyltransferase